MITKDIKEKMIEEVKAGEKFVKFARELGVSRQRISQIIYQRLSKEEIKKIKEERHQKVLAGKKERRKIQRLLNKQ